MKVLNVSVVFPPAWQYGGPPTMAHVMAKKLIAQGHYVFTLCTGDCRTDSSPVINEITEWDGVPVIYCSRERSLIPFYSPSLRREAARRVADYDAVKIHSSWTYIGPAASVECRKRGIPYLAYPEGNFDSWALRRGRFKKAIFWQLGDKRFFSHAAAVVGLTKHEVQCIHSMGIATRIELVPNGVDASEVCNGCSRRELEEIFPSLRSRPIVLFLGRLHPVKALPELIRAFSLVHRQHREAILVIAGPDEGGHQRVIEQSIRDVGLMGHVLLTGSVSGTTKVGLLRAAEVFVLCSFTEGFSRAVLEAMICGKPLVLTKMCHIPEVTDNRAGIELDDVSPREIANAISNLLSDDQSRAQMGQNAYRLVADRFSLDRVASMTADLCRDIASRT